MEGMPSVIATISGGSAFGLEAAGGVMRYLEERGINTRLALFIPDYIDHKEQKEYIKWLNNVKNFVA